MGTATWTGAFSTDYYDPSNWMSGFVPGDSDTAIFGTTSGLTSVTLTTGSPGGTWQFTGGSYAIIIVNTFAFFGAGVQVTGGNDILIGGAGKDALYGGPGADTFVYQQLSDSRPAHPDTIMDFKHAQHDKLDLFDLFHAANHVALRFIGAETFHQYQHAHHGVIGMVRYAGGEVQVKVNATLAPDLAIVMNGAPALHGNDFIL